MARWWRGRRGGGPTWQVSAPRRRRDGAWHGVEIDVDGHPVSFEVLGHRPAERVEAILTAFVPSALAAGATLVPRQRVDPGWAAGIDAAATLMATWWGHAPTGPVRAATRPVGPGPDGRGTALCFTAGVDSFWALLHGGHDPTHLLYVVGYDIDPDDDARVEGQMGAVRAVAQVCGLTPLFVRTDLRRHPAMVAANWSRDHGAAIAAAGLFASDVVERIVIPPSYADGRLIPWGSRPDLDPLWSVAGVLDVVHSATDLPRCSRVQSIAGEPLVQRHLRVCWEHRSDAANCGECEKCVRTMAMAATTPHLPAFATLPGRDDLAGRIEALHPLPDHHVRMWRDLRGTGLPPEIAAAVDRLTSVGPTPEPDRPPGPGR